MAEMEQRLMAHLEDCLEAIAAGESVQSCLARYPQDSHELAPLLEIALALEGLPQPAPSAAVSRRAKHQFMAEAERRRAPVGRPSVVNRLAGFLAALFPRPAIPGWLAPARVLATAALALALILLVGGGVIHAAAGSLPGEPLYGFKLLGEDIQRALAFGPDSRIQLEEAFTARRQQEVEQLLARGRSAQVNFGGLLQTWEEDRWLVAGIPVVLTGETRVQATPTGKVFVEIHGVTRTDGTVLARLIEIEGDEIVGRVESMQPQRWQVAGQQVRVDAQTHLQPGIRVGDCVEVHARRLSGGIELALEIELTGRCGDSAGEPDQDRDITPTPAAQPTSMPSPQPTASATPTPAASPTSSPTPSPASRATATTAPKPSPTADAAGDEELVPTPQPTAPPTSPPAAPSPTPVEGEGDEEEDEGDGNENDNENEDENDNENDNESDDEGENGNENEDENENAGDNGGDGDEDNSDGEDNTNQSDDEGSDDNENANENDNGNENGGENGGDSDGEEGDG